MSRFEIYDNEVFDTKTRLIWQRDYQENLTWQEAINYAESLGNGWRLPTIEELLALVDITKHDPATEFPDMPSVYFWSSSSYAADPSYAWYVYFGSGSVNLSGKSNIFRVRCVRRGGPIENLVVPVIYDLSLTGRF